ncbi:MAG: hypothetical protein Q7K55_00915 [Candidatus Levybacteria bacterium]|nr:hypothetical protein [Candidatus Levybacteria bacterium]
MEESNLDQNPPQNNIPQSQQPVQPVENQAQVSKPAGKSKLPILFIIFIFLIIFGSGVYYFLGVKGFKSISQTNPNSPSLSNTWKNSPTPTIDETANPDQIGVNWKTYTITPDSSLGYADYQIRLPITWEQIEHSSNFQGKETFQDRQNVYKLIIEEQKNYNDQTKKPFESFRTLTELSYDVPILTVDGQQAAKVLPRAGSEHIYQVLFFSKDAKLVYSITLETPSNGSKIQEGEVLFDQILSTFKLTP